MNHLRVSSLGPIKEADITFGDLTLLVGPQASGKSILLQLIKLLVDKPTIESRVEQYGFIWGPSEAAILERYFGDGMSGIWDENTKVQVDDRSFPLSFVLHESSMLADYFGEENLFYVPAQRIICLQNGWPRFFNDYEDTMPYVLKDFSETIRLFADSKIRSNQTSFIYEQHLNGSIFNRFSETIFNDAGLKVDTNVKKRFALNVSNTQIPFTVWSAGQKEFLPLLLSFFYLCPEPENGNSQRAIVRYVVIEEPEMGLHPQAIKSVMLQILDLMHRGYQVIVSTHSPVLLELLWAINYIKNYKGTTADLFELFSLQPDDSVEAIFNDVIASKTFATYFFDKTKEGVAVKNISTLDAGSDDPAVASWGGLTDFASRSGDVVSKLVANEE